MLCARKGVPTSTVYRWLKNETDPQLGAYDAICARLEAALDEEEAALRRTLGGRHTKARAVC